MTVSITGVITDDLGYPLEGASVYAAGQSAMTGAGGIYTLDGLPITQVVNDIGTLEANITATAGDFNDQNANLATVPVSVAYSDHTPAVVYVGTHMVVTDSCESATNAGGAGTCTSNSPNTIIVNGLAGDSGSVALKRLAAKVRGYLENYTTGAPAPNVEISLVPFDNNVSNITGVPGVAAPYTAGAVTWGHKASDLVTTTNTDGYYELTGIAVDTNYDIFVTSTGYRNALASGLAAVATGRTLTRDADTGAEFTTDNVSQCATTNGSTACIGTVDTRGGIIDMPIMYVVKSTLGSSGQDNISPYIKSVAGVSTLASTSTSGIHGGVGFLQLTEGIFTTAETDVASFAPSALSITFSETMDSSRFQPDATTSQAPVSVVIFDTDGNEYAVDATNTSLSGTTLTLAMSTASMPVSKGTALLVRLRSYDHIDTGSQELTISNTLNTTITNANAGGYNVASPTGWVTLRLRTFIENETTATAITLTQSDYTAYSTGSTTLYQYEGLSTYLVPMELRNAYGLNETADISLNGTAGIVGQLNAGSASRLETLAESLSIAATVDTTIVELGFTGTKAKNYYLTVKDTSSDIVGTSNYAVVAGKTYTNTTIATTATGDGIEAGSTLSASYKITATDATQKIWLKGMVTGYTAALYPVNDFGDPVIASGSSVVLADKIPPMVTVQQSLTSAAAVPQDAPADTITTDTSGTDSTTSAGDNIGGGIVTTDTTVFEYPNFDMEARFYVNANRENSSTYLSRPLLGN
ncbi:MAG: hypothetical protein HQM14_16995, partial [SAR324 cluster bacterium]|nr:hypothetical protein [SAR324 cluster bacterium]